MIKTFFINSTQALYDDVEFAWLQSLMLEEGVLGNSAGTLGLQVTQSGTPGMSVAVSAGKALVEITKSGRTFKVVVENDASAAVVIPANTSGANRVGAVIVRVDVDTEPNVLKNNVGTIEYIPGDDTSALSDGDIDTAVGSDGWLRLANVTVVDSETEILNADIADVRVQVELNDAVNIPLDALSLFDTTQGGIDQSQTGSGSSSSVGATDGAGNRRSVAQSFIPTKKGIKGARLYKKANTGSFTGDLVVTIQADVAGAPSGTPLATKTITNALWNAAANDSVYAFDFDAQYEYATPGATYWLVIVPSTGDSSNMANLGAATSNPYANGELRYWNTTDGWTLVSGTDLYFVLIEDTVNQIVRTNSAGVIESHLVEPLKTYYFHNTGVGYSSNSTENTAATYTLPVDFFDANSGFRLRARGDWNGDSGATVRVKANGTEIASMGLPDAQEGGIGWQFDVDFLNNNDRSSQVVFNLQSFYGGNDAVVGRNSNGKDTRAINTNVPVVITITIQNSANSADEYIAYGWSTLERIQG